MFKRICYECSKEISYGSKSAKIRADNLESVCKSCCKLEKRNGFYGKKHKKSTIKKISEISSKQIRSEKSKKSQSAKMSGSKNSMYGKTLYDHWVDKHGKEEANKKYKQMVSKQSEKAKGKNNPMYGKPSPQGSGNGWCGWYKRWFFRSLRELSYVINYLEENNLEWISAEKKKFTIPYKDWDGTSRTYRADFFVDNKKLVEIKPNRLKQAVTNRLKAQAAKKFCKKNGYEYEIVEAKRMKDDQILDLYEKGLIKFIDRYDKKFKEKFKKVKKN